LVVNVVRWRLPKDVRRKCTNERYMYTLVVKVVKDMGYG
jgi:hypothetical protein